jgi:3-hydroxyisobutyrate dehydrogenase-like beta-hydroxyacid dehydrogenase
MSMGADMKEPVGIVGIGRMGLAIAGHLRRHGHPVVVHDVDPKRFDAARALGAETAATAAAVAKAANFVIVAVGYDNEVNDVMTGPDGLVAAMKPGGVIGISSTCSPEQVRALAAKAAETGVDVVDAPICRGAQAADAGTMLALVGCKPPIYERARAVYGTFCSDIALLGPAGAGQFGKAMNNFLLWVNGIALIEAGRLAEASDIDLVVLRDALLKSSGASDALKNWENVSFIWALKDMQIVSAIADQAGLSLPVAGAIKELVKDGLRTRRSNPPDWTGRNR